MRISEIFLSLQGEGLLAGVRSVFVRVAGCNLACVWCDTTYARNAEAGTEMSVAEILAAVRHWPEAGHVVVTGGEPTLAPELPELTCGLREAGLHITLETNATRPPAEGLAVDLVSLSPKLRHAGPATPPIDIGSLRTWLASGYCQLKLACEGDADQHEILALYREVADLLPRDRVLLMPLTTCAADTAARRDAIVRLCLAHGFRYAVRLHLELFGGRRGF